MSLVRLTPYDNTSSSGEVCAGSTSPACRETFEYSTQSERLSCVSCDPSGERPLGSSNLSAIAPVTPEEPPFPQLGNLSRKGKGRLFFESRDALLPSDTNGHIQDVYEWEPDEVGSCRRPSGCVALISSGHGSNDSMFLDSSASGNDAFFITRSQLVPADKNAQLDLYDARVKGGFTEAGSPGCAGEGCAGPLGAPPVLPSPTSAEFTGPGNPPKPKPKKKHHKKHHHKPGRRGSK
jgi:hypothetical protein